MGSVQLGITITDADAAKIVTFLKALKGDKLTIVYPQLPESTEKLQNHLLIDIDYKELVNFQFFIK